MIIKIVVMTLTERNNRWIMNLNKEIRVNVFINVFMIFFRVNKLS